MKIGLNLLHARPAIGGGWTYIANLLEAVERSSDGHEYVAFVNAVSRTLVSPGARMKIVPVEIGVSQITRVLYENTYLQARARRERLDLMHWFANIDGVYNAVPAAVTVYDLHPIVIPGTFSAPQRAFLSAGIRRAVRRGGRLLPISQATATDLTRRCGARVTRMTVIPPILDACFQRPDSAAIEHVRRKYRLPSAFWLYVASLNQHKNHVRLLEAYAEVRRRRPDAWPLVLRADRKRRDEHVFRRIEELDLKEHVLFLPPLERTEMAGLYGAASSLVYPSVFEGGAMPVCEGLVCGCPVVAADLPVIRECARDAARYFDPLSVEGIAEAMEEMQQDPAAGRAKAESAREQLERYRGPRVAAALSQAYLEAMSSGDVSPAARSRRS